MPIVLAALLFAGLAGPSHAVDSEQLEREIARLVGHSVQRTQKGYRILDIASEGAPLIGCIHRVGSSLLLVNADLSLRLTGALAIPRIAGPNYKVWIIGQQVGDELHATRLGILARPSSKSCEQSPR